MRAASVRAAIYERDRAYLLPVGEEALSGEDLEIVLHSLGRDANDGGDLAVTRGCARPPEQVADRIERAMSGQGLFRTGSSAGRIAVSLPWPEQGHILPMDRPAARAGPFSVPDPPLSVPSSFSAIISACLRSGQLCSHAGLIRMSPSRRHAALASRLAAPGSGWRQGAANDEETMASMPTPRLIGRQAGSHDLDQRGHHPGGMEAIEQDEIAPPGFSHRSRERCLNVAGDHAGQRATSALGDLEHTAARCVRPISRGDEGQR